MACVGKHKTPKQIKAIAEQQANRTTWIDGAMVAFSGLLYFNLIELSLISVSDLITSKGKINKGFLIEVINFVIEHRIANGLGVIKNTGMYCNLDPDTEFFLNDKGESFKLKKNTSDNYQPYSLRRHMKSLNIGEGIDTRSLNESFIANVWNASRDSGVGDVDILKSLQKLTGLATNTLRPKVIRRDRSVIETVKSMYENL